MTFDIAFDSYYGYPVVEVVSNALYLAIGGTIRGSLNGGTIAATLSGDITAFNGPPYSRSTSPSTCTSNAHHITFVSQSTPSRRWRTP